MITTLLIALTVLDALLIAVVIYLMRRQEIPGDLLSDLSEEKNQIQSLYDQIKSDLEAAEKKSKDHENKMTLLAAQVEQEVSRSGATISQQISDVATGLSAKIDAPMQEVSRKLQGCEQLLKKMDIEKLALQKLIQNSKNLVEIFSKQLPYEEVLKEIERKKYKDARELLARGIASDKVAADLGLSSSEMHLIRHVF